MIFCQAAQQSSGQMHLVGIKCNAPANSRLLRFPGSISSVHQMFVTQQGALHFMCFLNAIAVAELMGDNWTKRPFWGKVASLNQFLRGGEVTWRL
jgi:hypothetical protein